MVERCVALLAASRHGRLAARPSLFRLQPVRNGLQPYQVSPAWLLSRPAVASAIVGAETVEEITVLAAAADIILEQGQLEAVTALRASTDDG